VGVTFAAVGPMVVINLEEKPNNLLIIAISIAFGMIPIVSQQFFGQLPHFFSGILLASVAFSWRRSLPWCSMLLQWCSRARNARVRPVDAAHGVGGVELTSHDGSLVVVTT
jgi:hypothetical protein